MRRSRELLETEIERFSVVVLDGMIIGCAALYPYQPEQMARTCLRCCASGIQRRGDAATGC